MASTFAYEPLDRSRREIRLLQITSRAASKAIHCELHTFDLDKSPKYKALSYTWGGNENLQRVRVNGHDFMIRPNLFEFLRVYNKRKDRDLIWIDQLCIDQESTLEKNHQVAMMNHIYRGAEETLMWFGLDPYQGRAFTIIRDAAKRTIDGQSEADIGAWLGTLGNKDKPLFALLEAPYWKRQWVAQEVILSTTCIMCYGTNELLWEEILTAWTHLVDMYGYEISTTSFSTFWYLVHSFHQSLEMPSHLFETVASFARKSICKNPRDKVYGIQSVLPKELQLPVNYHLPVRTIYLGVIKLWYVYYARRSIVNFLAYCIALAKGMRLTTLCGYFGETHDQFHSYLSLPGHLDLNIPEYWLTEEQLEDFLETRILEEVEDDEVSESQIST